MSFHEKTWRFHDVWESVCLLWQDHDDLNQRPHSRWWLVREKSSPNLLNPGKWNIMIYPHIYKWSISVAVWNHKSLTFVRYSPSWLIAKLSFCRGRLTAAFWFFSCGIIEMVENPGFSQGIFKCISGVLPIALWSYSLSTYIAVCYGKWLTMTNLKMIDLMIDLLVAFYSMTMIS